METAVKVSGVEAAAEVSGKRAATKLALLETAEGAASELADPVEPKVTKHSNQN